MTELRLKKVSRIIGAMIFLAAFLPILAMGSSLKSLSLDDMAKKADVIAVGKVVKKEAAWVGRHIETTFRIEAKEYWKGDLGSSFEFTQMGGEVFHPLPIAMESDSAPRFFEGEKVVLFLEKPKTLPKSLKGMEPPLPESRVPDSFRVIGWAQGKYTVLTDPKSGEEKVVRLGLLNMRVVDRRDLEKRRAFATAYAKKRLEKTGKSLPAAPAPKAAPLAGKGARKTLPEKEKALMLESSGVDAPVFDKEALEALKLPSRESFSELKEKVLKSLK